MPVNIRPLLHRNLLDDYGNQTSRGCKFVKFIVLPCSALDNIVWLQVHLNMLQVFPSLILTVGVWVQIQTHLEYGAGLRPQLFISLQQVISVNYRIVKFARTPVFGFSLL